MKKYIFIVVAIAFIEYFVSSQECPQDQICVPLDHCSSVNERMYEPNLNDSEINYLRSLQCNYVNKKVHVCCNSSLPKPGNCGKLSIIDKIINGQQTSLGEYPWVTLLSRRWRNFDNSTGIKDECGGSLINDRYVLTAAHCVQFFDYNNFRERLKTIEIVKLGEWNRDTNPDQEGQLIANRIVEAVVEKIIPHENYRANNEDKYNDIALLRLKEKVEFSRFIKPICLPHRDEIINSELKVIGWGVTDHTNSELEAIQRWAGVDYVHNDECNLKFENRIKSTQLCAGSNESDSCAGDSGGPLIDMHRSGRRYYYLVGIVSFGISHCGTKHIPGVYTDVRKYIDWIEQNIIH